MTYLSDLTDGQTITLRLYNELRQAGLFWLKDGLSRELLHG